MYKVVKETEDGKRKVETKEFESYEEAKLEAEKMAHDGSSRHIARVESEITGNTTYQAVWWR